MPAAFPWEQQAACPAPSAISIVMCTCAPLPSVSHPPPDGLMSPVGSVDLNGDQSISQCPADNSTFNGAALRGVANYTITGNITASVVLGCAQDCGANGLCAKAADGSLVCECECGWTGAACAVPSGFCPLFPADVGTLAECPATPAPAPSNSSSNSSSGEVTCTSPIRELRPVQGTGTERCVPARHVCFWPWWRGPGGEVAGDLCFTFVSVCFTFKKQTGLGNPNRPPHPTCTRCCSSSPACRAQLAAVLQQHHRPGAVRQRLEQPRLRRLRERPGLRGLFRREQRHLQQQPRLRAPQHLHGLHLQPHGGCCSLVEGEKKEGGKKERRERKELGLLGVGRRGSTAGDASLRQTCHPPCRPATHPPARLPARLQGTGLQGVIEAGSFYMLCNTTSFYTNPVTSVQALQPVTGDGPFCQVHFALVGKSDNPISCKATGCAFQEGSPYSRCSTTSCSCETACPGVRGCGVCGGGIALLHRYLLVRNGMPRCAGGLGHQ